MTVGEALVAARQRLTPVSEAAAYEARLLLGHIMGQSAAWLYGHQDQLLSHDQKTRFMTALNQRASGFPMAYIMGTRGFYHWDFVVDERVLIPRPETELLVQKAHHWLQTRRPNGKVVDVGTGSGIIAVSLALLVPTVTVYAIDMADLSLARHNAQRLGADVQFLQGDLLSGLPEKVDLIAANLPYIPTEELAILEVALWEPHLALDGGNKGLELISRLLEQAPAYLQPGGVILLEIAADQGEALKKLGAKHFSGATITIQQDLAGLDRLTIIQTPEVRHDDCASSQ